MIAWLALLNIVIDVPAYHKEMENRENQIHECLISKTCTSKYDPQREAYIITYNEPPE